MKTMNGTQLILPCNINLGLQVFPCSHAAPPCGRKNDYKSEYRRHTLLYFNTVNDQIYWETVQQKREFAEGG